MMTWNIEGLKRNVFCLEEHIRIYSPHFILLSEPQIFLCDINLTMQCLKGEYSFYLNSEDRFNPSLPLLSSRAFGGTMALWKNELDPFITVYSTPSSSILPLIFQPVGLSVLIYESCTYSICG